MSVTPNVNDTMICAIDRDDRGAVPGTFSVPFTELAAIIEKTVQPVGSPKDAEPVVLGARFSNQRRTRESCVDRNVIPVDVDEGLAFDAAVAKCRARGIAAVVHTTARHTPTTPRLRIFVLLSRPVTGAEWPRVQAWVKREFPTVDERALDIARISYWPVKTDSFECAQVDGQPLDVDALPPTPVAASTISVGDEVLPYRAPPDETRAANLLAAHWPADGKRALAHLYLGACLVSLGWSHGQAHGFLDALYTRLGEPGRDHNKVIKLGAGQWGALARELGEHAGVVDDVHDCLDPRRAEARAVLERVTALSTPLQTTTSAAQRLEMGAAAVSVERSKKDLGDVINDLVNHPEWAGVLRYDEFADRVVAVNPPVRLDAEKNGLTRSDVVSVRYWFETHGGRVSHENVDDGIVAAARARSFHPVRDYLASVAPTPGAIGRIAREVLGGAPMAEVFLRKFMIAAVRRVLEPGCFFKRVLVLQGSQEAGKSYFASTLFGLEWFTEQMPQDLGDRDASITLQGKWCAEFSELATMMKNEEEVIKAFVSRQIDVFIPRFGKHSIRQPRQCVLMGSTNRIDFLRDETGDVRWWVLPVPDKMNIALLQQLRDGAWGEAYAAALAGESIELTDEERRQADESKSQFRDLDERDEMIRAFCGGKLEVRSIDIFRFALGGDELRFTQPEQKRIARVLRALGFARQDKKVQGRVQKVWSREALPEGEAPAPPPRTVPEMLKQSTTPVVELPS